MERMAAMKPCHHNSAGSSTHACVCKATCTHTPLPKHRKHHPTAPPSHAPAGGCAHCPRHREWRRARLCVAAVRGRHRQAAQGHSLRWRSLRGTAPGAGALALAHWHWHWLSCTASGQAGRRKASAAAQAGNKPRSRRGPPGRARQHLQPACCCCCLDDGTPAASTAAGWPAAAPGLAQAPPRDRLQPQAYYWLV